MGAGPEERLGDEVLEHVEGGELVIGPCDGVGGSGVEAPGKDEEPSEERLTLGREQLVAPVEHTLERSVAVAVGAGLGQEPEPLIEAPFDLRRRHRDGAGGGELNGKGYPVEPIAQPGDNFNVEIGTARVVQGASPVNEE